MDKHNVFTVYKDDENTIETIDVRTHLTEITSRTGVTHDQYGYIDGPREKPKVLNEEFLW
jgi:hypothetical protein